MTNVKPEWSRTSDGGSLTQESIRVYCLIQVSVSYLIALKMQRLAKLKAVRHVIELIPGVVSLVYDHITLHAQARSEGGQDGGVLGVKRILSQQRCSSVEWSAVSV